MILSSFLAALFLKELFFFLVACILVQIPPRSSNFKHSACYTYAGHVSFSIYFCIKVVDLLNES